MRGLIWAGVLGVSLLIPSAAQAGAVLFEGSGTGVDGVTLTASVTFEVIGDQLKIVLRNTGDTSGGSVDKSANTLTGVFFDLPEGYTLTPTAAFVKSGSILQASTCDVEGANCATQTNVGGEFVFKEGSWSGHLGDYGISSSGYIDAAAGGGNFNGDNLDNPDAPDGINFGIVAPQSQSPFIPNTGAMSENPLIEHKVVLWMTIDGDIPLDPLLISNVSFQYGTSLSEPQIKVFIPPSSVPEPVLLLMLAPAVVIGIRRRRRPRSGRS